MSAKRRKNRPRARGSGTGPKPPEPRAGWSLVVVLSLAGTLALLALWGWEDVLPLLVVPLLAGLAVGCCSRTRIEALCAGAVSGIVGTSAAVWIYEPHRLLALINGIPHWVNQNVASGTYHIVVAPLLGLDAPMSAYMANSTRVPMFAAGVLLVPAFAFAAREMQVWKSALKASTWIPWVVSLLAAACLVASVAQADVGWFAFLETPLRPGTYREDQADNLRTLEIMRSEGKSYYPAAVQSAAGDPRTSGVIAASGNKFPAGSSALIRQPAMFYLWRLITLESPPTAIGWASLLCAAAILPLSLWGLRPPVGDRALFVGFALLPGLALWSSNPGALEPEWWAVLALLAAFFVLARGKVYLALVFGLAAVLLRETAGLWLLCACVVLLVAGSRNRRWTRPAAVAGGLLACAIVAFALHVWTSSAYVLHPSANGSVLLAYITGQSTRSLTDRALAPLAYLMFPYGLDTFSPVWLVPIGIVGLWVGLRKTPLARLVATSYVAVMVAFFFTVGATSTYWGQVVNPLIVIGVTLLALSLDRLGSPDSWRLAWPDSCKQLAAQLADGSTVGEPRGSKSVHDGPRFLGRLTDGKPRVALPLRALGWVFQEFGWRSRQSATCARVAVTGRCTR